MSQQAQAFFASGVSFRLTAGARLALADPPAAAPREANMCSIGIFLAVESLVNLREHRMNAHQCL